MQLMWLDLSVGCSRPLSGVRVVVMFAGRLLRFALSILNEGRRRNYALVASAGSQAGERGEGTSGTYQPFQKQQQ